MRMRSTNCGEHCMKAWSPVSYTTRSAAQQSSHMASGSNLLLEPTLRRTSYQDRKYDIQADARRGSIDLVQAGAGESALVQLKSALSTALTVLRSGAGKYCDMVVKDPDLTSKLESAFRLTSYVLPGRFGGSWELSELAYCASNLYALLNDYIVIKRCPAASAISKFSAKQQRLLWSLSLLDCVEVAIEITSGMAFSEPGKWAVVMLLQIIKAILRLFVVFKLRTGLLTTPSVPSPDRKKAQELVTNPQPPAAEEGEREGEGEEEREGEGGTGGKPLAWRATRTGKVIRSIHTDTSVPYSQLEAQLAPPSPTTGHTPSPFVSLTPTQPNSRLTIKQLVAEALYIARPLVHILSMFAFQQKSWKPWLVSLIMDIASLHLHGGLRQFTSPRGKSEVVRRRLVLLLYLLRSPFYEKYSESILKDFLSYLSSTLPLVHFIVDPVMTYLPVWQQVYSYNWMT